MHTMPIPAPGQTTAGMLPWHAKILPSVVTIWMQTTPISTAFSMRHAGVTSERHLIDGYRYCMARGWEKAAQICISHAFMVKDISSSIGIFDMPQEDKNFMERFVKDAVYDDYDRLVQLCDALALRYGTDWLK